jgi:D-alanine transaminase
VARVHLNGEYLDREQARLPLDDRGFLFGDGVYEVSRAVRGRVFEAQAHWDRLASGLRAISIDFSDHLDAERLDAIYAALIEQNELGGGDATLYLQVTRGAAVRSHGFPAPGTRPTIFASASAYQVPRRLREEGAAAITQPDIRWARCDIKSVNLLPNVMAKQRAIEAGAFEAVLLRDGVVTEGASSNIFGVLDGELLTYPLSNYILPGITRKVVLEIAMELGIRVRQRPLLAEELPRLDELFATGTATDVQPLVKLDGLPIASGRPGAMATKIRAALEARMGTG